MGTCKLNFSPDPGSQSSSPLRNSIQRGSRSPSLRPWLPIPFLRNSHQDSAHVGLPNANPIKRRTPDRLSQNTSSTSVLTLLQTQHISGTSIAKPNSAAQLWPRYIQVPTSNPPSNRENVKLSPASATQQVFCESNISTHGRKSFLQLQDAENKVQTGSHRSPARRLISSIHNNIANRVATPFVSPRPPEVAVGKRFRPTTQSRAESLTGGSPSTLPTIGSMSPEMPAVRAEVTHLNPSRKRRASTTEFDLRIDNIADIEMPTTATTTMSETSSNNESTSERESSRAFASYFLPFCAPLAFIQRHLAPIAAAVLSFVSTRSRNVVETRVLSPNASHVSLKRARISNSDGGAEPTHPFQPVDYQWATTTTNYIGKDNIYRFRDELVKALDTHGIVYDFSNDANVVNISDPNLQMVIRDAVCTTKVAETIYMSPHFLDLYHKGDPEIRPNLGIGSTKQAQEVLGTAVDFIQDLLKQAPNNPFSPNFAVPKPVVEAILEDILALRDGRIPPSLTRPAYGTYAEVLTLVEDKEEVDDFSNDALASDQVHQPVKPVLKRPYQSRPLPSGRSDVPGILKKGSHRQKTPKRLAKAKAMKTVTFRFPVEHQSPQNLHTPRCRFGHHHADEILIKMRARNKDVLSRDLCKYLPYMIGTIPPLPGEGLVSISGEISLSWDKIQEQREKRDREEQEKADKERKRREEEERKQKEEKLREMLVKTAGLKPARRVVLTDPTPDMVASGNRAASMPHAPVAKSIGGTQLHGEDFRKLVGAQEWLNDEAVNGLLEVLVNDINTKESRDKKKNPKVVFIGSLAHDFIHKNPISKLQRSLARQGITAKTLEGIETILVPRCYKSHWTLGVVRPKDKIIFHLDSMRRGNSQDMIEFLRKIVHGALQDKYVASEWDTCTIPCARQTNGYDCGMFTIMNSICVTAGAQPTFDGSCIRDWRYTISQVLIQGTFNGISSLDLVADD